MAIKRYLEERHYENLGITIRFLPEAGAPKKPITVIYEVDEKRIYYLAENIPQHYDHLPAIYEEECALAVRPNLGVDFKKKIRTEPREPFPFEPFEAGDIMEGTFTWGYMEYYQGYRSRFWLKGPHDLILPVKMSELDKIMRAGGFPLEASFRFTYDKPDFVMKIHKL